MFFGYHDPNRQKSDRERESDYRGDVIYDVYRSGGNVDRVDYDRVSDAYRNHWSHEDAAAREIRCQRPPQQHQEHEDQQYFPDEQFPDEEFEDEPE